MSLSNNKETSFTRFLPSPLTIAILLTFLTFVLTFIFTENKHDNAHILNLLSYWEKGLWDNNMLVFAFQMMLIMILGHTLALTFFFRNLIKKITQFCNDTATSAAIVTFFTIIVGLINWGLGLIFGAILARKVAERASLKKIRINYPLIGACGYTGMMVWHGGLSGSAPIKAATKNHLLTDLQISSEIVPDIILLSETIFSPMNIIITISLMLILPLGMYIIGKKYNGDFISILPTKIENENLVKVNKIDNSPFIAYISSFTILFYCIYSVIFNEDIDPINFINLCLLGFSILLHKSINQFGKAVNSAIGGAAGILIQFPLYFGILGIMRDSGFAGMISDVFVSISNENSFPIFTYISGAIVNIFVPRGGGQWAIQGPIIIEAASELGVSYSKSIMALSYGDQITNMLQPFWALPLLWITGLKAKEILPYSFLMFIIGSGIFILGLLLF